VLGATAGVIPVSLMGHDEATIEGVRSALASILEIAPA